MSGPRCILYLVQFHGQKYYVVAASYGEAVTKWQNAIAQVGNQVGEKKPVEPHSVNLFCEDGWLVL